MRDTDFTWVCDNCGERVMDDGCSFGGNEDDSQRSYTSLCGPCATDQVEGLIRRIEELSSKISVRAFHCSCGKQLAYPITPMAIYAMERIVCPGCRRPWRGYLTSHIIED